MIEPTTPPEQARILEKIWRARVQMRSNPYAMAMNAKLKHRLKKRMQFDVVNLEGRT